MDTKLSEELNCLHLQDVIRKFCKMERPSILLPKTATMSKLHIRYSRIEVTCNMFLVLLFTSNSSNSVFLNLMFIGPYSIVKVEE